MQPINATCIGDMANNNTEGAAHHRCGRLEAAGRCYYQALIALRESVKDKMSPLGEAGNTGLYTKWKLRLLNQATRLMEPLDFGAYEIFGGEQKCHLCTNQTAHPITKKRTIVVTDAISLDFRNCSEDIDSFVSVLLFNVGLLMYHREEMEKAARLLELSRSALMTVKRKCSIPSAIALSVHFYLGLVYHEAAREDESNRSFADAIEVGIETMGATLMSASVFTRVGHVLLSKGSFFGATAAFHAASLIYNQHPVEVSWGDTTANTLAPAA